MINIKKIFFSIILSLCCLNQSNAAITDSLFATIGNKAITQSDIVNEIKVILIVNGQIYSEERKKQLQTAAIKQTIKRTIKQIEIEKYKSLEFSQKDLNLELNKIAREQDMDLETFRNIFISNGINFDHIIDRFKTELQWNSLIFKIYGERLSINTDEINDQLQLIQQKKFMEEYLISEIIIRPVPESKIKEEINKIKDKIKVNGFKETAIELSIAESALKGGNLGWISENTISENFKSKIVKTKIGEISEPIFLPEGILFFQVRDKRKIEQNINLEEAKKQLVAAEKTKILNMYSLSHYDNLKRSMTINYY